MSFEELHKFKDSLTSFHNREALTQYLNTQLSTAQLQNRTFSLLIIDIDRFKTINDTYGHLAGDEALKFFASLINEVIKGEHFVARYGGDEFIIVMSNRDQKETLEIAKGIKALLNKKFFIFKERTLLIKSSMGIATFPWDGEQAPDLIKKADDALYYAKKHGRNRIVLASKVKSFYPKMKLLKLGITAVLIVIVFSLLFKIQIGKLIDFQSLYNKAIIKASYNFHKSKYNYNYCSLELDDQSKLEGWVIREDNDKLYVSKRKTFNQSDIIGISRKRIRIYIKSTK